MESVEKNPCSDLYDAPPLRLNELQVADGLEAGAVAFAISSLPCCAKAALPFWARVIGTIRNTEKCEVFVRVTVEIVDEKAFRGERYADVMILDDLETGEFDVKIIEFRHEARSYNLIIEKFSDLSEF